jgi:hypothetical protein
MLKKRVLTISFLLRLMAMSTAAQAGSTITDKSYWPEAAATAQSAAVGSQSDLGSALAYDGSASGLRLATTTSDGESIRPYHGGPKSP